MHAVDTAARALDRVARGLSAAQEGVNERLPTRVHADRPSPAPAGLVAEASLFELLSKAEQS